MIKHQNNKGTVKEKDTKMCLFELAVARVSYVATLTLARQGYIHYHHSASNYSEIYST